MKNVNKNLPVTVLKALKEFISNLDIKHVQLFHIVQQDDFLLKIADNDSSSGFYFHIEKFDMSNGLLLNYKPQSKSNTAYHHIWSSIKDVENYFRTWHDCLVEYADLEDFFNDPFLQNLEKQFFESFNLSEENKNEPLNLNQIYFLEEFFSKIENELSDYKDGSNNQEIEYVLSETSFVKSQLAKQTKAWVAKKASNIFARITKEGPGILKNIFKELGKEIITQGVKILLEHGDKFIR